MGDQKEHKSNNLLPTPNDMFSGKDPPFKLSDYQAVGFDLESCFFKLKGTALAKLAI